MSTLATVEQPNVMRPPNDFQVEDFHLASFSLAYIDPPTDKHVPDQAKCGFGIDFAAHQNEPNRFRITLKARVQECAGEVECGYLLEADVVGYVSIDRDLPEEERRGHALVNGAGVLYSLLRGIVATVSGSFVRGKFLLPTINPRQIVEDALKSEEIEKEQ